LLGGSSKNAKYELQDAKNIRKITDNICDKMKANLLVSTSRRTDDFIVDELESGNSNVKYLFKWQKDKKNPYLAILKDADFIIVTGDSIAMCCEACGFGKPVYIYSNKNICSKKHLKFQENLFKLGYASELSDDISILSSRKTKKLDEISKINKKIKEYFKF
jgi:mitochondrial fission protein ELM1